MGKVGVLPENYPQVVLTNEQMTKVEDLVTDQMISEKQKDMHFAGIKFWSGYLWLHY